MSGVSDVAAWARTHEASFEVAPLVEMVKGRPVQVGFTLGLFARLPLQTGPGPERRAAAAEVWERLREIAQSLAPKEGRRAGVEVESHRAAAVFQPEGQMLPEVALNARIFHGRDYFKEVTVDEEARLHEVTGRLTDLGLKERRRPTR